MPTIDLNSDLGEGYGPWTMGDDDAVLGVVTSANVACGGHAGDVETMYATCRTAAERGVVVGAHPGYPDRQGFGRRVIPMPPDEIGRMVVAQLGALDAIARQAGTTVRYCKLHGALANLAAADDDVSSAVVDALQATFPSLALLAISGTRLEHVARGAGVEVYSEIFADRGYQPDGQLVPRSEDGALITDVGTAVHRLLDFLDSGRMPVVGGEPIPLDAHSICVHGDTPSALDMANGIRDELVAAGVDVQAFVDR